MEARTGELVMDVELVSIRDDENDQVRTIGLQCRSSLRRPATTTATTTAATAAA